MSTAQITYSYRIGTLKRSKRYQIRYPGTDIKSQLSRLIGSQPDNQYIIRIARKIFAFIGNAIMLITYPANSVIECQTPFVSGICGMKKSRYKSAKAVCVSAPHNPFICKVLSVTCIRSVSIRPKTDAPIYPFPIGKEEFSQSRSIGRSLSFGRKTAPLFGPVNHTITYKPFDENQPTGLQPLSRPAINKIKKLSRFLLSYLLETNF